ncbi:MAG: hypothetical protein WA700_07650 [Acidobacteriaceae bacterium]
MEYFFEESKVILAKFETHVHSYIDPNKCETAGKSLARGVLARWKPQIWKEPKPESASKGCERRLLTSAVRAGNQGVNDCIPHPGPGLAQPGGQVPWVFVQHGSDGEYAGIVYLKLTMNRSQTFSVSKPTLTPFPRRVFSLVNAGKYRRHEDARHAIGLFQVDLKPLI